ncbi:MAG: M16 family metallopeptidase [Qingshengfaniella sp.]
MGRVGWLVLALVLLPARLVLAEEVTEFTLDNGMKVVVIEDHRSPAVVHAVWYNIGAADEAPGLSGVAHLLEHLMFKGTAKRAPGEFSRVVAENGGADNAFTSWDYTAYFQRVAADRLDQMMEMEADRMTGLRLTPEVTGPELNVVLEERNQRIASNPGALFREQQMAAQYLNHPYGRPIIGWPQELAALTRDKALAFYRAHYVPNDAILIVAGDVTPDAVRRLAETHYGPIPPNPDLRPRARVSEPPQLAERRLVFTDPRIGQPYVTRSYLAPERDSGAQQVAAALDLLASYLGGSPTTSYLARKLQFDDPVAIYVFASYGGVSLDRTTFELTLAPVPGVTLEAAEAALDGALAQFLDEGIDAARLDRLKRQYAAEAIYADDNVQRIAQRYGRALTAGLTVADVQAWPGIVQATTADQIMAAARQVFDRRKAVTGYVSAPQAPQDEVSQ